MITEKDKKDFEEQEKTVQRGRGGARPGAGRKPTGSIRIQIRVSADEMARIKKAASASGITWAGFCKNAVLEKIHNF